MTRDRSLNFPHARAAAPVAGSAKSSKAHGRTLQQLLKLPLLLLMLLLKPLQLLLLQLPLPPLPVPHQLPPPPLPAPVLPPESQVSQVRTAALYVMVSCSKLPLASAAKSQQASGPPGIRSQRRPVPLDQRLVDGVVSATKQAARGRGLWQWPGVKALTVSKQAARGRGLWLCPGPRKTGKKEQSAARRR